MDNEVPQLRPILTPRRMAVALLLPALLTLLSCPAGKTDPGVNSDLSETFRPTEDMRMGEVDLGVPVGGGKDVTGKDGVDSDIGDATEGITVVDAVPVDISDVETDIDPCAGIDCEDGDQCTHDECVAGECVHTSHDGACEDGNACTVGDTCADGQCVAGEKLSCDDGNPCTDDACSSVEGCLHVSNSKACSDGDPCTDGDVCEDGQCLAGTTVVCHPCQTDGDCLDYDDGDLCNGVASCVESLCQVLPESVVGCPDDLDDCIVHACAPETGQCIPDSSAAPVFCNDSDACTLDDQCDGAVCVGKPINCTDGDACTIDWCNPTSGCVHDPKCEPPKVCTAEAKCCTPMTCGMIGMKCGLRPDTCGKTIDCGDCPEGEECKAGVCSDGVCKMELVASLGGTASSVVVKYPYAYVGFEEAGLYVFDVSVPESPEKVGEVTDYPIHDLQLAGERVFARAGPSIAVVDDTLPTSPLVIPVIKPGLEYWSFQAVSDELLAYEGSDKYLGYQPTVTIVELSDVPAATVVATYEPTLEDIAAFDAGADYLVLVRPITAPFEGLLAHQLEIVDLSEPWSPELVAVHEFPPASIVSEWDNLFDMRVADNRAYLLTGKYGDDGAILRTIDLTDHTEPTVLSTSIHDDNGAYYRGLTVSAGLAFLYKSSCKSPIYVFNQIEVVDVSNPAAPFSLAALQVQGQPNDVVASQDNLYIAGMEGGLLVVDIGEPGMPAAVGQPLDVPGAAHDSHLLDGYLLTAAGYGGLKTYDLRDPPQAELVSTTPIAGRTTEVAVVGTIALLASGKTLRAFDVSTPAQPVWQAQVELLPEDPSAKIFALEVSGSTAYALARIGALDGVLVAIDIASGTVMDTIELPTGAYQLDVTGSGVYVIADDELLIFDATDPAAPELAATHQSSLKHFWDVRVVEHTAYLTAWWGIEIVDVSDFYSPVMQAAFIESDYEGALGVVEPFVFASAYPTGKLRAFEIVLPSAPVLLDEYTVSHFLPAGVCAIHLGEGLAVASACETGVDVLDVSGCW